MWGSLAFIPTCPMKLFYILHTNTSSATTHQLFHPKSQSHQSAPASSSSSPKSPSPQKLHQPHAPSNPTTSLHPPLPPSPKTYKMATRARMQPLIKNSPYILAALTVCAVPFAYRARSAGGAEGAQQSAESTSQVGEKSYHVRPGERSGGGI